MAVNTVLLDFTVDPKDVKNESQLLVVAGDIENVLRDHLSNFQYVHSLQIDNGVFKLYTSDFGGVISLRIFSNGLITLNIEYYKGDKQEPILSYEVNCFLFIMLVFIKEIDYANEVFS